MTEKVIINGFSVDETLAFRPGESFTIRTSVPDNKYKYLYAVCMASVPTLPGRVHQTCEPFCIVCARWQIWDESKKPSWGWTHLDPSTKDAIGNELVINGADPDIWYYMTINCLNMERSNG